jgi:hypothetical protein
MANAMYELFKKEINAADDQLYSKGYTVESMDTQLFENEFEIVRMSDCKVVVDHLSVAQVQQIAAIL